MEYLASYARTHRTELLIFCVVFLIRAAYAVLIQTVSGAHGFISHADAEFFYYRSAVNLFEHGTFSIAAHAPYYPDAYHTPLYSILLAALLYMRIPLIGIILLQSTLAAGTAVLIYIIGLMFLRSRMLAVAAALIAALEPMAVYWGGLLMSDTLFAFLITLSLWFLIQERNVPASVTLGLAALTRPIALYFAPFFLCMIAYQWYTQGKSARDIGQTALVSAILMALIMLPWFVRNKVVFDEWAFTSAGWYELYSAPLSEFAESKHLTVPAAVNLPPERDITRFDFKYSPKYKAAFISVVQDDPLGYLMIHVKRSLYSFVSNRYDYLFRVVLQSQVPGLYSRIPTQAIFAILAAGFLFWISVYALCLVAFIQTKLRSWWIFFAALLGINALLSGAINPGGADMSRYMLALYAPLFLFACAGARWLWQKFRA